MIETVGVVGLGSMGLGMAQSLARAGFAVLGFDLDPARCGLADAKPASMTELLATADAIVCSLPLAKDVEQAIAVPALLERGDRRVVVLDTSTSDPATSRRLAALLDKAGHGFLDAPVSGGPTGAASGTLAMMMGGAQSDVALARPVIDALAATALHVGPSGSGNVAKLVNNLLVAAHMLTTREALRLAEAAGVDAEAVLPVINAATGRSALSEVHVPKWIVSRRFDSGFSAGLMRKDVRLAMALADELGLDLTLSQAVAALWRDGPVVDTDDFTRMGDYTA